MNDRFQSIHWGRVADTRPALSANVRVVPQASRGQDWMLLHDCVSRASFRLNRPAWALVGRFDGHLSVDDIWRAVVAEGIADAPSQDEMVQLIATLGERGLLDNSMLDHLHANRSHAEASVRRSANRFNPLAVRIPFGDPTRVVAPLSAALRPAFGRVGLALWAALVAFGLAAFVAQAEPFTRAVADRALVPSFLLMAWLIWPFMKGLHELAHALMLMRVGGQAREWGLTWWIVAASPYVDAADAATLPRRRDRILVSAAGVMCELALAAVAMMVWCIVEPGLTRDAALAVVVIGAMSSVLFNINPLMRSDGYFVMIDLFDLPNLDTRARQLLTQWVTRFGAGAEPQRPLVPTRREAAWYWSYLALAMPYRITVSLAIVGWLCGVSTAIGLLAAACTLWQWIVSPLRRAARFVFHAERPPAQRRRGLTTAAALVAVVVGAGSIPVPRAIVAAAVVWVPEGTLVRSDVEGIVAEVPIADRQPVQAGDVVVRLDNPALDAQLVRTQADIRAADAEVSGAETGRTAGSAALLERLANLRAKEAWLASRIGQLSVRAPTDGVLALHAGDGLVGRYVHRGEALAHVVGRENSLVRAVLTPTDAPAVAGLLQRAEVRLNQDVGLELQGANVTQQPGAVHELPARFLGDHGGGSIETDTTDPDGLRTRGPVFIVDVGLDRSVERIGGRASVRFDLGREPLMAQAWRLARQVVLSHVDT